MPGLWRIVEALQGSKHLVVVAAMQSMAMGEGSGAHSACAGRLVFQNSISGSLPTEIGLLSRLVGLYDPSLC